MIRRARTQRGMTLIELMVALAIGSFLIAGAVTVYVQSRTTYRTNENVARMQENARFAMETMAPDIRMAGHWGLVNKGVLVSGGQNLVVQCDGNDVADWALDVELPLETLGNEYDLPCAAFDGQPRNESDVLVIRRATGGGRDSRSGTIQVQSTLSGAVLFGDGNEPITAVAPGDAPPTTRDVLVHAYYIAENSSSLGAGVPSLRRHTLVRTPAANVGRLDDQEIIPGIEDMQIQLGVDTNGDGAIERYVDAGSDIVNPDAGGFLPGARVLAVRVWLLVRGDYPETGFEDTRVYPRPDGTLGPFQPQGENRAYRRVAVSRTILVRNSRGRNQA